MESDGGSASSSRWNPTNEQIRILENLYEQGIRTPTAHQIQHITGTLSAYSHIQAKNVFYWFQNHKARLRQKQRQRQTQQTIPYFNRFLHMSHPFFSSPPSLSPNVVCAPFSHSQCEMCLYPQHSKVVLPMQHQIPQELRNSNEGTLPLFPLHPTGFLEGKKRELHVSSLPSVSAPASTTTPSGSSHIDEDDDAFPGNQPFFDFLSLGQASPVE